MCPQYFKSPKKYKSTDHSLSNNYSEASLLAINTVVRKFNCITNNAKDRCSRREPFHLHLKRGSVVVLLGSLYYYNTKYH